MKTNFAKCLAFTLKYEGGYVNHPADPGGATNKGVTQAVYDKYRKRANLTARSVKLITNAELEEIYRKQYWAPVKGDELDPGLDLVVFDYGVNSGPSKAVRDLQRILGVAVDGVIGVNTLTALDQVDNVATINKLCDARLRFYKSLKTWSTFGKGWTRRIEALRIHAIAMVEGVTVLAEAKPEPAPAKAVLADQAKLKTAEGAGLTAAGCGAAGQTIISTAQQVQPHIGDTVLGRLALAAMAVLMIVGGILIGYSYLRRMREAGGIGGLFNSKN